MQINLNQNPTNFKSVTITKDALKEMSKRLTAGEFTIGLEKFKEKYANSPVDLKIDVLDKKNTRLDAMLSCEKNGTKAFTYFTEKLYSYLLDLNPKRFLKKVGKEVKEIEKYCGY